MDNMDKIGDFLFYQSDNGIIKIQVIIDDKNDTIWVTQSSLGDIFDTSKQNVSYHLGNIFKEGELVENSVVKEILTTASDGKDYNTKFYNLDVIISVGYRINSRKATQFRIWATSVIKEYMTKGFALDDERLKQGKTLFGKDYFNELIERIREIRASERRFYQKITDIYSACSIDYDKEAQITQKFFATVQNKLHFAITNHTAAEIIALRADSKSPNMGLTSWKDESTGGKIHGSDVVVAKNYLKENEIKQLNRIVNMYLDYAENIAERQIPMKMQDWIERLDSFLKFNEYGVCIDAGKIKSEVAKQKAKKEFEKFRIVQDREYVSDFDKVVKEIKATGQLPKPPQTISIKSALGSNDISDFNKSLKTALDYKSKDKS